MSKSFLDPFSARDVAVVRAPEVWGAPQMETELGAFIEVDGMAGNRYRALKGATRARYFNSTAGQAENDDPLAGARRLNEVMRVQPFRLRIIYEARATRDDPELNVRHATRNAAQDAVAWGGLGQALGALGTPSSSSGVR